jgi:Flp pilus assembly protein TadG
VAVRLLKVTLMLKTSAIRRTDRRGAVIVEFAICAPLFFLVVLALFEFSWLNVVRHTADNAAYEASRVAMVPGATAAEAIGEAQRIMAAVGTRGATVTVDPPNLGPESTQVTVNVVVPVDQNALVVPAFTGGRRIETKSTLRTERVETR